MNKRKVHGPDGKEHEATVLEFQNAREHWNEYLLDDGTILKLKPVATEVMRIDGVFDAQGQPVYVVMTTNIVTANAPEHLRRGEKP
mgnify:FL=1